MLAAGGSKGELAVWDVEENETIAKHFTPTLDKTKVSTSVAATAEDEEEEEVSEEASDEEEQKKPRKKKPNPAKTEKK